MEPRHLLAGITQLMRMFARAMQQQPERAMEVAAAVAEVAAQVRGLVCEGVVRGLVGLRLRMFRHGREHHTDLFIHEGAISGSNGGLPSRRLSMCRRGGLHRAGLVIPECIWEGSKNKETRQRATCLHHRTQDSHLPPQGVAHGREVFTNVQASHPLTPLTSRLHAPLQGVTHGRGDYTNVYMSSGIVEGLVGLLDGRKRQQAAMQEAEEAAAAGEEGGAARSPSPTKTGALAVRKEGCLTDCACQRVRRLASPLPNTHSKHPT